MDDAVDTSGLVAGRFRVEGLLGSGGTASVFRAYDTETGRTVALKLLHPHLSQSDLLREAFLVEAQRAARVRHPGIVAVLDTGTFEEHGIPIAWIAQELVDGVTLSERVRVEGPLSSADAAAVACEILDALAAAHATGLVHRDVSPANVLVRLDAAAGRRATLLDFGLADAAGATAHGDDVLRSTVSPASAGVVGNVEFASPEQLSGRPVGPAGDLYQVGGLLHFALTGRAPYAGADRAAVIRAHLHAPPPVPSVAGRDVPAGLDRVVVRALLKDPAARFADAAAMRDATLAAVAASRAPVVEESSSVTRVLGVATRRVVAPLSSAAEAALASSRSAAASGPGPAATEHRGPGWGAVVALIAVLAAAAAAVPLVAGAGRAAPTPVAVEAPPSPTATEVPGPLATAATPVPVATTTAVPALDTLDAFRAALTGAGLQVADIAQRDAPSPAGTVLSTEPAPGSVVPRGSSVRLVVASGANTVPEVGGMDAAAAASALRAAGFTPAQTTAVSSHPPGTVVAVEPAAGASVRLGGTVTVTIAASAPTPTPTATMPAPTPIPTPTATPTAPAR
jgi:serine/threonine-protein kinase